MNPADTLQSLAVGAWAIGPDTLLGATLLLVAAALLGEVVWRTLRWPRLMGYVAVGAVLERAGASADPARPAVRLVVDVARPEADRAVVAVIGAERGGGDGLPAVDAGEVAVLVAAVLV